LICKSGIFVFILSLSLLYSCENDIEKVKLVTEKDILPVETASNLTILYSDSAKIKMRVQAKKMNRYAGEDPYTEMEGGVKLEFFNDSLFVTTILTSNKAFRKDKEQIMEAMENVTVINSKNEKLNTEHLIWDESESRIFTTEFVKITTENNIIFGEGFESNQQFTNYKIFKIRGTINLKNNANSQNP